MTINLVIGCLSLLGFALLACAFFRDLGYKRGAKDGDAVSYERGRVDADNWWLETEREVDQARQKIWKEEG